MKRLLRVWLCLCCSTWASNLPPGTTQEVDLTWKAPATSTIPVVGYNVYRTLSGQSAVKINTSTVVPLAYNDLTLAAGSYSYTVKSVGNDGSLSPDSNVATVVIQITPSAPTMALK